MSANSFFFKTGGEEEIRNSSNYHSHLSSRFSRDKYDTKIERHARIFHLHDEMCSSTGVDENARGNHGGFLLERYDCSWLDLNMRERERAIFWSNYVSREIRAKGPHKHSVFRDRDQLVPSNSLAFCDVRYHSHADGSIPYATQGHAMYRVIQEKRKVSRVEMGFSYKFLSIIYHPQYLFVELFAFHFMFYIASLHMKFFEF